MPYKDPELQKKAQHESYLRNKEKAAAAQRESRRKRKEFVNSYKESNPCADCGEFFPHYVMDFDHIDGSDKLENVSRLVQNRGIKAIKAEMEKCDLVCANDHRKRTFLRGYDNQYS